MELSKIKGIGPKTIEHLNKLNIYDVDSLVRFFPYRYNIFTPVNIYSGSEEDTIVISGTITSLAKVAFIKRNFNRLSFTLETNNIMTNVVIYNRAFLKQHLLIGKKITLNDAKKMVEASKIIIAKATEMGGTTIRSYTSSLGVYGSYQSELKVQSRDNEKCLVCGSDIEKIRVGGRGTYFCPKCQKKK